MARSGGRNDASGGSWAVALSYAAMMCLAIAINLLPVFLTTLGHDLGSGGRGLSNEQLGRIGAVTLMGLVLAILLTGPLADRLGLRRMRRWRGTQSIVSGVRPERLPV